MHYIFDNLYGKQIPNLTPKDPWVFGCKTTQNYPFWKNDLKLFFDKYFSRSNHMIKYKTCISTTSRSFIFFSIST
jgi:hypothetical protein